MNFYTDIELTTDNFDEAFEDLSNNEHEKELSKFLYVIFRQAARRGSPEKYDKFVNRALKISKQFWTELERKDE